MKEMANKMDDTVSSSFITLEIQYADSFLIKTVFSVIFIDSISY